MTTQVTVQYDGDRLLERSRQQQQAARQVKASSDRIKAAASTDKAQQQRAGTLPQQQAQRYGTLEQRLRVRDEPAAFIKQGSGFGFIDVRGNSTGPNADQYFTDEYQIGAQKPIRSCKVIRVVIGGLNDACVNRDADPSEFFAGKAAELRRFMISGGVLWINNEYAGCGIDAFTLNQYIATAFGATIGFVDNTQSEGPREFFGPFAGYGVVRSQLAYAAQVDQAPPFFYTAATCSISGGTVYYSSANGVTCAFEKRGRGFLVLSGDQNGTGQFPSYTEGSKNFIDALLAL